MNHQSQCPHCYEWFHGSHYCPVLNKRTLTVERATVLPTLTEQRVREIVREELDAAIDEARVGKMTVNMVFM